MENLRVDTTTATPAEEADAREAAQAAQEERWTEFLSYILLGVVSAWGVSVLTFGIPGLVVPALLLLPVIFTLLLLITVGR